MKRIAAVVVLALSLTACTAPAPATEELWAPVNTFSEAIAQCTDKLPEGIDRNDCTNAANTTDWK